MEPIRYFVNNLIDGELALGLPFEKNLYKQRTEGLVQTIIQNFQNNLHNADGGLYVGSAGVSYMLVHLSKLSAFQSVQEAYLDMAIKYIDNPILLSLKNLERSPIDVSDITGFMCGNAGVFAVGAVLFAKGKNEAKSNSCLEHFVKALNHLKPMNWFNNGGDELFVGRAGFLCAVSWLRRELKKEVIPDAEVNQLLDTMLESGVQYAKRVRSPLPIMYHYYGTQYLGPAHGLSGILFVMLCYPQWLNADSEKRKLVQSSIDSLLQLQTESGNFPCAMDEVGGGRRRPEDELVHWCHGAPGVVYLMAKAYKVFGEKRYLDSAVKCGEVTWQKGLLKKGPGICHGVAGSGYVFLLLYQLTGQSIYLRRASLFLEFTYTPDFTRARTPDCPYSLFEGLAGTACFAGDLTQPEDAEFPFFGVF